MSHPVIARFSKEPDVLSQWRGYADNAQGWSIGFSGQAIDAMPVSLLEVVYDPTHQVTEVRNFPAAMYLVWREKGGDVRSAVGQDAALLASYLHAYKHPSFKEEQEVRAIHELRVTWSDDGLELLDEGGVANGQAVQGEPVGFRATASSIIARVDIPASTAGRYGDPRALVRDQRWQWHRKCPSSLSRYGHRRVNLFRSASSYRA